MEHPIYRPRWEPLVWKAFIDTSHRIWLEVSHEGKSSRWRLFDVEGNPLGKVQLRGATMLLAASRSYAWGVDKGKAGTPEVLRFPLAQLTEK